MPNSVEKTMLVLRALSDAQGASVTLAALSEKLHINKSTLAHILKTLCRERYVLRVSHSKGYMLGPELYYLTRYGRFNEDLIALCRPFLKLLHKKSGGTAVLAVMEGAHKYIIDFIDGVNYYSERDDWANANILDDRVYRTVTGRAILAALPEHEAIAVYETLGAPSESEWAEASDRVKFRNALASIRKVPFYYDSRTYKGLPAHSFAVPLIKEQRCVGALGLSVVLNEETGFPSEADLAYLGKLMIRCREEAARRLMFE